MNYYLGEAMALAYGVIAAPKETMILISKEQRLYEGAVIWSLSVLLSIVSVCAQWDGAALWTAAAMYGGAAVLFGLRAVLIHGSSRFLGGCGAFKSLLAVLCFAEIPLNLATLAGSFVFAAPEWAVQILSLGAVIWTFVLDILSVQAVYGMSAARSTAALVLPVLAAAGICVILILYVFFSVISWLG